MKIYYKDGSDELIDFETSDIHRDLRGFSELIKEGGLLLINY